MMVGKRISHYQVLEELGRGGMGIVYRAYDTLLERIVALKFLAPALLENPEEKARLLQEARAAAALDHPAICTVYAIEEADDQTFMVLPFIDGTTLSQRLAMGPLEPREAVRIALQIAEGLAAAHEKGIIHRDIKSANVMLTATGQVKLTDFGLALVGKNAVAGGTGRTLGTPAYVAPEQIHGEGVDHRTDIWACGVVLYEMVTGSLPFQGTNEHELIYAILADAPAPMPAHVPQGLQRIISRCLQKDPADRFQSARDLAEALRSLQGQAAGSRPAESPLRPRKNAARLSAALFILMLLALLFFFQRPPDQKTVLVLDFINQTGEPELSGLSGMLITALEPARYLKVVPRWRLLDLLEQNDKPITLPVDEATGRFIARQAEADLIAIGTVKKIAGRYGIEIILRDVQSGTPVFSTTVWKQGREAIPDLIDLIAMRIRMANHEDEKAIRAEQRGVAEVTTGDLKAYQDYFLGEQLLNRMELKKAGEAYARAIARDSLFALAYYRLAYVTSWQLGNEQPAKTPLQKAISLMDRLPARERFLLRAEQARMEQGLQGYLRVLKQMEQFYPEHKEMLYNIGDAYMHLNRLEEAITYLRRVVNMDPTFGRALQHLALIYKKRRQYPQALAYARRYVSVTASPDAYFLLAQIYQAMKDFAAGIRTLREAAALYPENAYITVALAAMLCLQGEIAPAVRLLENLRQRRNDPEAVFWGNWGLAFSYPYQGRYREALQASDAVISFHRQNQDTASAAIIQVYKGLLHVWGWQDTSAAWKEIANTRTYQNRVHAYAYWLGYIMLAAYRGEYNQAMEWARQKVPEVRWLLPLILSLQGKYEQARTMADTLPPPDLEYLQLPAQYALAQALFRAGKLEAARQTLLRMREILDQTGGFRAALLPKSYYLLGRIHEQQKDTAAAIAAYQTLLSFWTEADADLPELVEARHRLQRLQHVHRQN